MATRQQIKRGTSAQWAATNPVLQEGEFGFDKTTNVVKMGNGTATWSTLPTALVLVSKAELDVLQALMQSNDNAALTQVNVAVSYINALTAIVETNRLSSRAYTDALRATVVADYVTKLGLDTAADSAVARNATVANAAVQAINNAAAGLDVILASTARSEFVSKVSRGFDVHDYGAVGDGVANDTPAIEAAIVAAEAAGGGTVFFRPGKTYKLMRFTSTDQGASIRLRARVSLDGQGATLRLGDNCSFIGGAGYHITGTGNSAQVSADVARNATVISVDSVGNFVAGDEVALRLGDNPWDAVEVRTYLRATVLAVDAVLNTITLDRPVHNSEVVATVTNPNNRRISRLDKTKLLDNLVVRNFRLINPAVNPANAEAGIYVGYSRNVLIENIYAEDPGAGLAIIHYCDSVTIRNCMVPFSNAQNGQQSKGRIINAWNTRNLTIDTVYGARFAGCWAFIESYCKNVVFRNCLVDNTHTSPLSADLAFFIIGQGSESIFEGLRIEGRGGRSIHTDGATESYVHWRDLVIDTAGSLKGGLNLAHVSGLLRIRDLGSDGALRTYQLQQAEWVERVIRLTDGMYADYYLDPGLTMALEVYASTGFVKASHLSAIYIGKTGDNGTELSSGAAAGSYPAAEGSVRVAMVYGTDYFRINDFAGGIKVLVTAPASGVTGADVYIVIRQLVARHGAIPAKSTSRAFGEYIVRSKTAQRRSLASVSTNTVLTDGSSTTILASGTITVTLPSAVVVGSGREFVIKNTGAGVITVGATAGTVEAAGTSIAAGASRNYISDGTNWFVI